MKNHTSGKEITERINDSNKPEPLDCGDKGSRQCYSSWGPGHSKETGGLVDMSGGTGNHAGDIAASREAVGGQRNAKNASLSPLPHSPISPWCLPLAELSWTAAEEEGWETQLASVVPSMIQRKTWVLQEWI